MSAISGDVELLQLPTGSKRRPSSSSTAPKPRFSVDISDSHTFSSSRRSLDRGNGDATTTHVDNPFSTPASTSLHDLAEHTPVGAASDTTDRNSRQTESPNFISALPPVDTGKDAWFFLAAATICETLIYGLPFSIGVLHTRWVEMFGPGSEATVTLAATLQAGLLYMLSSLSGNLFIAYPRYTKQSQYFGVVMASASFLGAAFATKPWHLIVTVGLLYPFAGATYMPCATLLFEWFQMRRGTASGIMYAGTGVGGAFLPFLIAELLNKVGYKWTMIGLGVSFGVINGVSLTWIKRRVPLAARTREEGRRPTTFDWRPMRTQAMAWGTAVILLTSFANFVPTVWLPSFANDLNLHKPDGVALVALMNAASVPGAALTGLLSDHLPLRITIIINCVVAALSCSLLWGFGKTDGPLIAFALMWGLTGLSFVGTWSKIVSLISGDDISTASVVFSIFTSIKGVGNFSSGPLSDALLKLNTFRGAAGAYGVKNYGVLLVYCGAVMFCAGVAGSGLRNKKQSRLRAS